MDSGQVELVGMNVLLRLYVLKVSTRARPIQIFG
jgi:hypothetical protein